MGRWIKAVLVGLVCGALGGVLSLLVELATAVARMNAMISGAGSAGSGGLGAVSSPLYAPFVALVGFVGGFVWRATRPSATRTERLPVRDRD